MGTVVGSNIINLGYILGAVAFFGCSGCRRLAVAMDDVGCHNRLFSDLLLGRRFVWWEGALLLLALLIYIATLVATNEWCAGASDW